MNRVEKHREICNHLNKIYEQKNHDYGNSFGETFEKLGIISAVTRLSDKYNRICSLATKSETERQVKDENIRDTLIDLANYAIMTIIEMDNAKENECECDDVAPPVKAKWIVVGEGDYTYCSACGHQINSPIRGISCPNCHALMVEE